MICMNRCLHSYSIEAFVFMYWSMFWALRTIKREQHWLNIFLLYSELSISVLSSKDWHSLLANRSRQADYQRKHCRGRWIPEVMLSSCVLNPSGWCPGSSLCSSLVWSCQGWWSDSMIGSMFMYVWAWQEYEACQGSTGQEILPWRHTHRHLSLAKTQIKYCLCTSWAVMLS